MTTVPVVRAAFVDEMDSRRTDLLTSGGSRTRSVCGRNFAVAVTELRADDDLVEHDLPDEYMLLLPDEVTVVVTHDSGQIVTVTEPSLLIVPAGNSVVRAEAATTIVRVFAAHADEPMRRATNYTAQHDPAVAPLLTRPRSDTAPIQVHRMSDVPDDPGRLGRIFRSTSLMVNWFPTKVGPRDTETLTPHSHADFEQMSVTLQGDFVHHFRSPWTPRMSEWRDDEHVGVGSPSMVLIPPNLTHTTRWVGEGDHMLIDVFAPPREDFLAKGWVLNADGYRAVPDDRR